MGAEIEKLSELGGTVTLVLNPVSGNGVGQLIDRVEKDLVANDREGTMSRARPWNGIYRGDRCDGRGPGLDLVDAKQVGSEIRNNNEPLGRVENCLVQMRDLLAVGVGARSVKSVGLIVQETQGGGISNGKRAKGGGIAGIVSQHMESGVQWRMVPKSWEVGSSSNLTRMQC